MKEIVEFFSRKNILFKKLEKIDIKKFGIKKHMVLYSGIDMKNHYSAVVQIKRKSRFVTKDAKELEDIVTTLPFEYSFKRKYLLINTPICSKAKEYLVERGWSIYAFV